MAFLTSIMVSLPPDMIRPSGYSEEGPRKASELMNSWPWVVIDGSKAGGFGVVLRQTRTVLSREAEMTASGEGKATARTCESARTEGQSHS